MPVLPKEYGRLSFDELVQLIELVNSLPAEKEELLAAYREKPEKLRTILGENFSWGIFYKISLPEIIAVFSVASGFNQTLADIASSDDPTAAALASAFDDNFPEPVVDFGDEINPLKIVFASLMALIKSIEAIKLYGLPIQALLHRFEKGDDKALFKILRIDRSAVTCPAIADRISLAEFEGDQVFFRKMRNALKGPPLKPKDEYGVLRYIIYLLHVEEGVLDQMSIEERYSLFCERLSLYPANGEDPAKSLDQFISRWKKQFST